MTIGPLPHLRRAPTYERLAELASISAHFHHDDPNRQHTINRADELVAGLLNDGVPREHIARAAGIEPARLRILIDRRTNHLAEVQSKRPPQGGQRIPTNPPERDTQ